MKNLILTIVALIEIAIFVAAVWLICHFADKW